MKPSFLEVAPAFRDYLRRVWGRIYYPELDTIRKERGPDLDVYDKVRHDPVVMATMTQRIQLVIGQEWRVEPASQDAIDIRAADFIRQQVAQIQFDDVCARMLWAIFYGYSIAEKMLERESGQIVLGGIRVRNRRRFRFGTNGDVLIVNNGISVDGDVFHPSRLWYLPYGGEDSDDPYGVGLAYWLYWPVTFKRGGIQHWLTFLENSSHPIADVQYIGSDSESESVALRLAEALQQGQSAAHNDQVTLNLLEAAKGTLDYQNLIQYCDDAITKLVLLQTASSAGGAANDGASRLMSGVLEGLVKSDSDLLCESFNRQVIAPLVAWNFADAQPPRLWRVPRRRSDLLLTAQTDQILAGIGWVPTPQRIAEVYGENYTQGTIASGIASQPGIAEFSEFTVQPDYVRQVTQELDQRLQKNVESWVGKIRHALESSESLADFKRRLPELFPDMDDPEAVEVVRLAMQAVGMAGLYGGEQ